MARLRGTVVVLALVALSVLSGPSTAGFALSCVADVSLETYLANADTVFIGTVLDIRLPWYPPWRSERSSSDPMTVLIEVSEVYKGERVSIWTSVETVAHGGNGGFDFVNGRRYLIFAHHDGDKLTTSNCDGNLDLVEAANPFSTRGQAPIPGTRPGWWTVEKMTLASAAAGVTGLALVWWLLRRRRRRAVPTLAASPAGKGRV